MEETPVKKAVEIHDEDGHQFALLALFADGHATICTLPPSEKDKEKAFCYTTGKAEGETMYYVAQAFLTAIRPKAKVVKLHEEEAASA